MASFNSFDLGLVQEWSTSAAPKDRQINAYNGVDGLENIDLGARGGTTTMQGLLGGSDIPDLKAIKAGLRALQVDGDAYTFIDPEDTEWDNVILVMFRTVGPRYFVVGDAGVVQRYELELLHLN